jgi:hypothetical protein
MQKYASSSAALVLSVLLASCEVTPDQMETSGPPPENFRELTLQHLRATLFDPYSVRDAEIAAPTLKPSWVLGDPPGWVVCWRANAKNRMGGYVGVTESRVLIRNGRVVSSDEGDAPYYCGNAVYQPFPELEQIQ